MTSSLCDNGCRGVTSVRVQKGGGALCDHCHMTAFRARTERAARERTALERKNAKARGEHLVAPTLRPELAEAIARAPRFAPIRGRR